MTMISSNFC